MHLHACCCICVFKQCPLLTRNDKTEDDKATPKHTYFAAWRKQQVGKQLVPPGDLPPRCPRSKERFWLGLGLLPALSRYRLLPSSSSPCFSSMADSTSPTVSNWMKATLKASSTNRVSDTSFTRLATLSKSSAFILRGSQDTLTCHIYPNNHCYQHLGKLEGQHRSLTEVTGLDNRARGWRTVHSLFVATGLSVHGHADLCGGGEELSQVVLRHRLCQVLHKQRSAVRARCNPNQFTIHWNSMQRKQGYVFYGWQGTSVYLPQIVCNALQKAHTSYYSTCTKCTYLIPSNSSIENVKTFPELCLSGLQNFMWQISSLLHQFYPIHQVAHPIQDIL